MSRNNIVEKITHINRAASWSKCHLKGGRLEDLYNNLVHSRRRLKKIEFASRKNPAAAVYGESQVGKSYLIKSLLSIPGEEFKVTDPTTGNKHDFLKEINPKGAGSEATSMVSRFSVNTEIVNENYPIKIRLFSPTDIVLFLIDSCLNELKDSLIFLRNNEIDSAVEELSQAYGGSEHLQYHISEDDVYDIRDYMKEHFPNNIITSSLKDSSFWQTIPALIHKIPSQDWYKVFGLIWNHNKDINNILNRLIEELAQLDFSEYAYLKMEAVLRDHGTLLDVQRLHELVSDDEMGEDALKEFRAEAEVLIDSKDSETRLVQKKYLCALTEEIIFKLDDSLLESKPFLKNIDLLDFPGARSRPMLTLDAIQEDFSKIILRGKVAYIFHKYSDQYLINYLLFCNRNQDINTTGLPQMLNNWICKYIGETPDERDEYISGMSIDPLFVIFTYFNMDLMYDSANDRDANSLHQKWDKRFNKIFLRDIVSENYSWHINWTKSNPYFKNFYLLRDIRLSEELSNLYSGYFETGREIERITPPDYPDYWDDLHSSFIDFPFIKKHFRDPEESWNEAATINKDGSDVIIANLNLAAETNTREHKFDLEVRKLWINYLKELERYHHSDEADKRILSAINKARQLNLGLNLAVGQNPYFFGKLLNSLMVDEGKVYSYYYELLNSPEIVKEIDRSKYAPILIENPELSLSATFDENVEVLRKKYGFETREETTKFFDDQRVDLHELFFGQVKLMLNRSEYLAEKLMEYWLKYRINSEVLTQNLTEAGLNESKIDDIVNLYETSMRQLNLKEIVAQKIRKHVDGFQNIQELIEMVADISAEVINSFVNTIGIYYYDEDQLSQIKRTIKDNNLELTFDPINNDYQSMDEDALVELFDTMENMEEVINNPDNRVSSIRNIPVYGNYSRWLDMMKIAFVASCDIPTYDVEANKELEGIIEEGRNHD